MKNGWFYFDMPETSFNNRLAQRPHVKQKHPLIGKLDLGVFVSQAHKVRRNGENNHIEWRKTQE